ncbi:galanin receptor 2a-like [Mya arenaria]|uniref:galanin receptor 2a-like n=1 Tax=Mya arenaria TaxID=6604 RepID=UPI0022E41B35|nr:galanin receptor 2a-like [Mya arenaria]
MSTERPLFTLNDTINFVNVTSNNLTDNVTSPPGGGGAVRYFPWANPQNIMTQDKSDDITSFLQCYIFPILTVFGITGNAMSLAVLLQKKMRGSTTTVLLIGLACSDILFLVFNAVRKSTGIIEKFDQEAADTLNATTFYYMFYLKTAFSRVSTVLVVAISVERFIAVAFPFKVKTIVTKTTVTAAVALSYVVTLGFLAVLPPQYTFTYIRGKAYISQTPFALNNVEPLQVYNEYFLPIAFRHIPVAMVLLINGAIIILLRQSSQFQKRMSTKDDKRKDDQRRITRTLLTVAIVFLLCLLPGDIFLISSLVVDGFQFFGTYHNLFLALSDICLMFEMINGCLNFVIYMVMNRKFYDEYVRLFCCCSERFLSTDGTLQKSTSRRTTQTTVRNRDKDSFKAYVVEEERSVNNAGEIKQEMNQSKDGFQNKAYIE